MITYHNISINTLHIVHGLCRNALSLNKKNFHLYLRISWNISIKNKKRRIKRNSLFVRIQSPLRRSRFFLARHLLFSLVNIVGKICMRRLMVITGNWGQMNCWNFEREANILCNKLNFNSYSKCDEPINCHNFSERKMYFSPNKMGPNHFVRASALVGMNTCSYKYAYTVSDAF